MFHVYHIYANKNSLNNKLELINISYGMDGLGFIQNKKQTYMVG